MSHQSIDPQALQQLFFDARTFNAWTDRPVADQTLHQLYELLRMPPTAMNCSPARIVFVRSPEAKQKLNPLMAEGNRAKTLAAPVTAIVGYDAHFFDQLPTLFPVGAKAVAMFAGNATVAETTAFRNGTLQVAYLILAARSLGLDCGPMSGFDNAGVDAAFFAGTHVKSNVVVNLGYGDPSGVFPRNPRLDFADACQVL